MRLSDRIANALALDTFDRRHKVGLALLVVAMLTIVVVWFIKLRQDIIRPLYGNANNSQNNVVLSQEQQTQNELKVKDTDGDTLNDWDELNLYKTSPYLSDTDSDTFSDKQEIESGNDPTCPQGQSCTVTTPTPETSDSNFNNPALENLLNQNSGSQSQVTPTSTPSSSLSEEQKAALRETFGATPSATELRQFLLQSGMEQKAVDVLTDEEILATFNEMIK